MTTETIRTAMSAKRRQAAQKAMREPVVDLPSAEDAARAWLRTLIGEIVVIRREEAQP